MSYKLIYLTKTGEQLGHVQDYRILTNIRSELLCNGRMELNPLEFHDLIDGSVIVVQPDYSMTEERT